ncbi:hypothetical protein A6A08_09475 [Nocardiopsis sp. TSRI0078]|uniref:hypothetical protein n=1 Tax=unclassified Nocardiopsis TaxID=2649073 RepID=UPI00093EAC89|nr:hypothetical protein [Nocardiopsis sp. TSRI0078]OKI15779.1 hypothetical protein A6A08_09475 [Nocardiopsis sp. TSRI0078]
MRTFTRIAAATMLAGGLTVAGAGTALADPKEEGILGHVLTDLLGPHVPDAESFQGDTGSSSEEAPANTGAPEQNTTPGNTTTPGEPMAPAAGTGDVLP